MNRYFCNVRERIINAERTVNLAIDASKALDRRQEKAPKLKHAAGGEDEAQQKTRLGFVWRAQEPSQRVGVDAKQFGCTALVTAGGLQSLTDGGFAKLHQVEVGQTRVINVLLGRRHTRRSA